MQTMYKSFRLSRIFQCIFFSFILLSSVLLSSINLSAQGPKNTTTEVRTAFAFEQLSVTTSSTILTATTYNPTVTNSDPSQTRADLAIIQCEAGPVRMRNDGTAPTTSIGLILNQGDSVEIWGFQNIANTELIASATVACDIEYFRVGSNAQ